MSTNGATLRVQARAQDLLQLLSMFPEMLAILYIFLNFVSFCYRGSGVEALRGGLRHLTQALRRQLLTAICFMELWFTWA